MSQSESDIINWSDINLKNEYGVIFGLHPKHFYPAAPGCWVETNESAWMQILWLIINQSIVVVSLSLDQAFFF